jgi:NDP-sugar pyrophosphorylase family protein
MKAVVLAGGLGTRISEETSVKPKPMIGGRIKRIIPYVEKDEHFFVTYGDGVGNVDINATLDLNKKENRLATVTAVQPPGRFEAIKYEQNKVQALWKNRRVMADGSMEVFLCFHPK